MKILKPGWDPPRFHKALAGAPQRALLLDYDGTLAPFRVRRDEVRPYPGVREALDAILAEGRCRVVLISGRAIRDLLPLLGLARRPEIWGSHAWERLRPGGVLETVPLPERTEAGLARAAQWLRRRGLDEQWERKPTSIALHWRGLPERDCRALEHDAREAWRDLAQDTRLEVRGFDGGIELAAIGRDKGHAVRTVLAEMSPATVAAYLGDDRTDEDAFAALHARRSGVGLAVLVRAEVRKTTADWWLRPPGELLQFLKTWRTSCGKGGGTRHPKSAS